MDYISLKKSMSELVSLNPNVRLSQVIDVASFSNHPAYIHSASDHEYPQYNKHNDANGIDCLQEAHNKIPRSFSKNTLLHVHRNSISRPALTR